MVGSTAVEHVIEVLAELVDATPERHFVLAGGLAVMARIGLVYRVTLDIDAVTTDEIQLVEIIDDLEGSTRRDDHPYVHGVKIDVLAIEGTTRWDDIADLDGG